MALSNSTLILGIEELESNRWTDLILSNKVNPNVVFKQLTVCKRILLVSLD